MSGGLRLSALPKTWFFDLDGTLVVHNGFLFGKDTLLPGVLDWFRSLSSDDFVVIVTSRSSEYRIETERFLLCAGIRYDHIIFDLPNGERILLNDRKASGLTTAIAVNCVRDQGMSTFQYVIDPDL